MSEKDADTDKGLVLLARLFDPYQAEIVRGLLEQYDIPCFIFDRHHTHNAWHIQNILGVRMMVRRADLDRARDILRIAEDNLLPLPDGESAPACTARQTSWAGRIFSFVGTIIFGIPVILRGKRKG